MGLFLIKEIRDHDGGLHFQRWRLVSTRWFSIYIHRIAKADRDKHPHNHPWNFIGLVLRGGYTEEVTLKGYQPFKKERKPFGAVWHERTAFHRIVEMAKPTWTVVLVGKHYLTADGQDDWGYLVEGEYIDFKTYRTEKRKHGWLRGLIDFKHWHLWSNDK